MYIINLIRILTIKYLRNCSISIIFCRSDGFYTVTDPDGNIIHGAAESLQGTGGASMQGNQGITFIVLSFVAPVILKCKIV